MATWTEMAALSAISRVSSTASPTMSAGRHRRHHQFEVAGLDPGDVEYLVDQIEQMTTGPQDVVHRLGLLVGKLVHLQELGEAEDRIERRPQLVAHPGQKLALGPTGSFGRLPGITQPLFGQDPGRHVARDDHGAGEATRLVVHAPDPGCRA